MGEIKTSDIKAMSVAERLNLIERIWDTLIDAEELPVPAWHADVLDERLTDYARNPEAGAPWDDVKQRLSRGS